VDWLWQLLEFGFRTRMRRATRNELKENSSRVCVRMNHDILILPGGYVIHDPTCKKGIHTMHKKNSIALDERDRYRNALKQIQEAAQSVMDWNLATDRQQYDAERSGIIVVDIQTIHELATEALNGSTTGTQRSNSAEHGTTD
jgi:hypothetical protein